MGSWLVSEDVELFSEFEVFLFIIICLCIHLLPLIDPPTFVGHVFIRRMSLQSWVHCWLKVEKVGCSHNWLEGGWVKGVEMGSGFKGVWMGSGTEIENFLKVFFAAVVKLLEHQVRS
jgi:hypothetical protein